MECALLILISFSAHIFRLVSSNLTKCDFSLYGTGCEDPEGSMCDHNLNECVCKTNYTIKLKNGVCLKPKMIDEECISSAQCSVENSACFAKDGNLELWKCQCSPEFWYNIETDECERKSNFGELCQNNTQCMDELYCSLNSTCVCNQDFYFNSSVNKCLHFNSSKCDDSEDWNPTTLQCVPKMHYSHRRFRSGGLRVWYSGSRGGSYGRKNSSLKFKNNPNVSLSLTVFIALINVLFFNNDINFQIFNLYNRVLLQ
jgi:hypothetical protein